MVKNNEPVKPVEFNSESSEAEIELNLVESSVREEGKMGVARSESVSEFDAQDDNIKIINLKRASTDVKESLAKKPKELQRPEKKKLFQRLWSEADEIVILKGMIDYAATTKANPIADLNAFHNFIKKDIHFEFSSTQLQNKIMKMRTKFKNNKSKEKNGKRRTFGKPHKQEAYALSEKIWNCEAKFLGGTRLKKNKENKDIGKTAQAAADEQWKSLKIQEIEAYMTQLEVKITEAKMVLDHLKTKSCNE